MGPEIEQVAIETTTNQETGFTAPVSYIIQEPSYEQSSGDLPPLYNTVTAFPPLPAHVKRVL